MITELSDADRLYPQVPQLEDATNKLSDDVLLVIFRFYLENAFVRGGRAYDGWHDLVHVCQRWRCLVFASPRHLDLRLLCTSRRQVVNLLDIWPALPIVVQERFNAVQLPMWRMTNVIVALHDQRNRVCKIELNAIPNALLTWIELKLTRMEMSFPLLTDLELRAKNKGVLVLTDFFLGGSAPRLLSLKLQRAPFPSLPKLLETATDLVTLHLFEIPQSGYISPVAIVTALSMLTRLKSLHLDFDLSQPWAQSHGVESRRQLPPKRIFLPALTEFYLWSDREYMEDMVSKIDTPLLNFARIAFSGRPDSDTPLLRDFISRTEVFHELHRAKVVISIDAVHLTFSQRPDVKTLKLRYSCNARDWQYSSLAHICNSLFPPLPTLERLEIFTDQLYWRTNMENAQWLGLLRPFSSVKDLFLFDDLVCLIAFALKETTGGRVPEVLPALQNLFLKALCPSTPSKPIQEAIEQFVFARQLSGRPVVLHYWVYRSERDAQRAGEWVVLHKGFRTLSDG